MEHAFCFCYNYLMRSSFVYVVSLFLIIFLACLIGWFFHPLISNASGVLGISSPVPTVMSRLSNPEVTTLNLWLPHVVADRTPLDLTAKSALAYDLTTNKVLVAKNPDTRLPMASLTKIMTAIIALENPKLPDSYTVRPQDLVGEDSMGLSAGESLTLSDLLYGLVLHSGNDAAETLADNFPGGRQAFITAMNEKAAALGLQNTHFTNPTGLEGDGNQYTTAADLLVLTRFALQQFPLFDKVVATFDYTIPATPTHAVFYLENETNLLTSYPGVQGVKTGYTPEAGLCLVTYLDYGGHQILAVILGSDNRRGEMIDVLDYSLKTLGITPPAHG